MKPRRDTYHDYVTRQELEECGGAFSADALLALRIDSLCRRAGHNVTGNAYYETTVDLEHECYHLRVVFDSGSWTGHDGTTPIDVFQRWYAKSSCIARRALAWLRSQQRSSRHVQPTQLPPRPER